MMKNNSVRIVLLTTLVGLNWYGFALALGQEGNPQQMIQVKLSAFKEAMASNHSEPWLNTLGSRKPK